MMSNRTQTILNQFLEGVKRIYGNHLQNVILYGSYARGDFREDSDIDIMILVDLSDEEIKHKQPGLSDLAFEIAFENDIQIMPVVKNKEFFYKWVRAYPFFNNVSNEGVELSAA